MPQTKSFISLDVGEKRIGVAMADSGVKIAIPYATLDVDGTEFDAIAALYVNHQPETIVIGYPRNQSGEPTAQTAYVEKFSEHLEAMELPIVYQDESLTSVLAEQRLKSQKSPYTKADIDAQAASIILQDYLEQHYAA